MKKLFDEILFLASERIILRQAADSMKGRKYDPGKGRNQKDQTYEDHSKTG